MTDDEQTRVCASPTDEPLHPSTSADRPRSPLFQLGQVVATPGVLQTLKEFGVEPLTLISRHVCGDWGDLVASDQHENNMALIHGNRILSAYQLTRKDGDASITEKVWIITESDRSSTTLLLPREY
jgi:hypothetical protein